MIVLQVSICMVLVLLVNYRKLFQYILLNPSSELCLCSCISCYILKPVNGVNTALVVCLVVHKVNSTFSTAMHTLP